MGPGVPQLHRVSRSLQKRGNRVRHWRLALLVLVTWSAVHLATQRSPVALPSILQLSISCSSRGTAPPTFPSPPLLLGLAVLPGLGLASLCGLTLKSYEGFTFGPLVRSPCVALGRPHRTPLSPEHPNHTHRCFVAKVRQSWSMYPWTSLPAFTYYAPSIFVGMRWNSEHTVVKGMRCYRVWNGTGSCRLGRCSGEPSSS